MKRRSTACAVRWKETLPTADRMESLTDGMFREILERGAGARNADLAFPAFSHPASVSVRLHPDKTGDSFARDHFGSATRCVPWSPWGCLLAERPAFTKDPLLHAGCYYVQDSSAMYVGAVFREALSSLRGEDRPLRVLDLCAAAGGKTTDLAASLRAVQGDRFVLVANEVMRERAAVLCDNVALWGDPCVVVTGADPRTFSSLEGFFDVIVADVPCSGEGMFRKDPAAVRAWSEETVRLCAARQRRILSDVWPALREGGVLVYATCTFEPSENDEAVEWVAGQLGADVMDIPFFPELIRTRTGALLLPGLVPGEGQFAAALSKTAPSRSLSAPRLVRGDARPAPGEVRLLPPAVEQVLPFLSFLRPLRAGVTLGVRKGTDLVPNADAALLTGGDPLPLPSVEVERTVALQFLHGDTLTLPDAPRGFLRLCFEGHPIGFVKNLGRRCNNLHPSRRRIRMDI